MSNLQAERCRSPRISLAIAVLALGIAWPGLAHAGIYNSAEGDELVLSPDFSKFRDVLLRVRSIGLDKVDVDNPLRKRYVLWEKLGGPNPAADLTPEQKLNYSAVLIRRNRQQEAIRYLETLSRQQPDIFLFQSHLATAYWRSGQPGNDRRALDLQIQLLGRRGWPQNFTDLNEAQLAFFNRVYHWSEHEFGLYRRMEGQLLKLMKLRLAEPPGPFKEVDALFDDGQTPPRPVRFVNEQGVFEPGKISPAEKKKLPAIAREIVQQLLLWLPEDLRLYWLLAELYNAEGVIRQVVNGQETSDYRNLRAAELIYKELVVDFGIRAPELRDRRQKLSDFLGDIQDGRPNIAEMELNLDKLEKKTQPLLAMDTRTLAVTFTFGFFIGLFALWQFQELRRRRRGD